MLTFTLAISCLTTSSLPWFMDLTFQVPMQYCSLQHRTLLLSSVTSTAGYCVCFGSFPPFFLELFLHWSPVAYWALTDPGCSFFSILSFCFSYCSWGSQGKNTKVACHYLFTAAPAKHSRCSLPWTRGISLPPPFLTFNVVLFIIGDWNAKVGSQKTPGVTGKFGLGMRNEARQRLIEF